MQQRISDADIDQAIKACEGSANEWGMPPDSVTGYAELMDLRDSRAELSTLRARVREMEWTKTRPTTEGWYWMRRGQLSGVRRFAVENGRLRLTGFWGDAIENMPEDAEWSSIAIPEPINPEKVNP